MNRNATSASFRNHWGYDWPCRQLFRCLTWKLWTEKHFTKKTSQKQLHKKRVKSEFPYQFRVHKIPLLAGEVHWICVKKILIYAHPKRGCQWTFTLSELTNDKKAKQSESVRCGMNQNNKRPFYKHNWIIEKLITLFFRFRNSRTFREEIGFSAKVLCVFDYSSYWNVIWICLT